MNPQTRKLFAVIVHYGPASSTQRALHRLLSGSWPDRIIVIDHAQTPFQLDSPHERMRVVRPAGNSGYGGGLNVGLGVLQSEGIKSHDIVICMNNDITVGSKDIERIRAWWRENPEPALVGVKLGEVNLFTGRTSLDNFQFSIFNFQMPYVHGSFFMAPYTVLIKSGGIPDEYFMYWEDVLLTRRAQGKGFPIRLLPGLSVVHRDSKTASPQKTYYLVRNGALFLEKETPPLWRVYWRIGNRLRLKYHAIWGKKSVYRALYDASH